MKHLSALLLLLSLFTLSAWTLEDCVEVDFDHPDCDRYTTTTTGQVTTTTFTDQTTITTIRETTTTQPEVTVTVPPTTTTIQQCPPGTIHQPPLCVETITTVVISTPANTTPDTTSVISPPEELPRTGIADVGLLALAGVSLLFLGFTALKYGRREE